MNKGHFNLRILFLLVLLPASAVSFSQTKGLKIIEVGTRAAAVKCDMYCMDIPDDEPMLVKVTPDHPFLYFIREPSTGTILFMGKVGDPTEN